MKLLVLSFALIGSAAFAADTASDLQKKFVGSWKLISIEGPNQTRTDKPFGIIMYDNTAKATDKEKGAAFDTYTAYYGTYTFEPQNGIVIHHLEGSIVPGQIGQDNIRYFELKGNRLTLSVANDGKGGRLLRKDTTRHLTWEKIPAR
jgi:hypothetical protein